MGLGFCTGFIYEIYLLINEAIKTYSHFSSTSEVISIIKHVARITNVCVEFEHNN